MNSNLDNHWETYEDLVFDHSLLNVFCMQFEDRSRGIGVFVDVCCLV